MIKQCCLEFVLVFSSAAHGPHLAARKVIIVLQTCAKQYKTAGELEVHLSSYDHHHKKASTCTPGSYQCLRS